MEVVVNKANVENRNAAIFALIDATRTIMRVSKTATYKTKAAEKAIEEYDKARRDLRRDYPTEYENYSRLFNFSPDSTGIDFFA